MIVSSKSTIVFTFILTLLFVNPNSLLAQTTSDSNRSSIYNLPPGTRISVKMDNEINSRSSSVNDTFTVSVAEPVVVNGVSVIPVGAVLEGRILGVKSAASGGKGGILEVKFETLRLAGGQERKIEGVLVTKLKAKSSKKKSILAIIGGTAIGAIIGAATRSSSGALIGTGLGAGAGIGTTLFMKGKEVRIKAQQKFEIELTKSVTLPPEGF